VFCLKVFVIFKQKHPWLEIIIGKAFRFFRFFSKVLRNSGENIFVFSAYKNWRNDKVNLRQF